MRSIRPRRRTWHLVRRLFLEHLEERVNPGFVAPIAYDTGLSSVSVAVGDLTGDGIDDLVVANSNAPSSGNGSISILIGNGDGTFQASRNISDPYWPRSVALADFNGDGVLDLVVADSSFSQVRVFRGNGDGTFQAPQSFNTGAEPRSVVVGDFNGDGIADIAVADYQGSAVSVLLGNGDGTFQPVRSYSAGRGPKSLAEGDFNGDGILDLAVTNYGDNTASILMGNGDGSFQPARNLNAPNPYSVAVGDLNGDGVLDLAVTTSDSINGAGVSVFVGNGDGTFQPPRVWNTGGYSYSVAISDLTGDGIQDIVASNSALNTASVLLGNGNGTFQHVRDYSAGRFPFSVAVGDFNRDGHPDIAVTDIGNTLGTYGGVVVLVGNGDGTFVTAPSYATGDGHDSVAVAVGDFAGDGISDLVTANFHGDSVSVLMGNGDGTFQPPQTYAVGNGPESVAVGDFNGDGTLDLAVINSGDNTVSILLGNGDGSFQPARAFSAGSAPVSVAVGDFNDDGTLDLVVTNYHRRPDPSNGVSVLLGNGDGTFQAPRSTFFPSSDLLSVAVADFNGDGIPDIVTTDGINNYVRVLLGNGDGTFQPSGTFPTGFFPRYVTVADFNGDGRQDLAISYNGGVSLLLGNGDGTFQPASNMPGNFGYAAVADFNSDGFPDLVVTTSVGVRLLLGNGDGSFGSTYISYVAGNEPPLLVAIGDFNGDGAPDVAVIGGGVSILLNDGVWYPPRPGGRPSGGSPHGHGAGTKPHSSLVHPDAGLREGRDSIAVVNTSVITQSLVSANHQPPLGNFDASLTNTSESSEFSVIDMSESSAAWPMLSSGVPARYDLDPLAGSLLGAYPPLDLPGNA